MAKKYICGLDIGTSKIVACAAEIRKGKVVEVFLEAEESRGVSKGAVVDSVELVESVGKVLKALKAQSGINIKAVYTNISGQDVVTRHSRAVIPLTDRGNKVISSLDIENVIRQAFILGASIEEEVIHNIPYSFTVDNKTGLANPLGLSGHKLEVDLFLVCVKLSSVQTINYAVNRAGYDVKEIFLSGLAVSEVVFDEEFKKGCSILCDIGQDITELIFFKDGLVRDIKILAIGGDDLTCALQQGLNISFEMAKDIKFSSSAIGESAVLDENSRILVKKDNDCLSVRKKQVADILNAQARVMSLCLQDAVKKNTVLKEIKHFVFTGRTILQEGFLEMIEANIGIPVEFARIRDPQIAPLLNKNPVLSGREYLTYTTAIGLICKELYGYDSKTLTMRKSSPNPFFKALNKLKEIYQEYF